jgi:cytochrome d ubiquinol oxidase subunit I
VTRKVTGVFVRFRAYISITFHYLFPVNGLSLIIVYFKWKFLKQTIYITIKRLILDDFFALNFAMGVVTGIPMEFQFGTIGLNFQN